MGPLSCVPWPLHSTASPVGVGAASHPASGSWGPAQCLASPECSVTISWMNGWGPWGKCERVCVCVWEGEGEQLLQFGLLFSYKRVRVLEMSVERGDVSFKKQQDNSNLLISLLDERPILLWHKTIVYFADFCGSLWISEDTHTQALSFKNTQIKIFFIELLYIRGQQTSSVKGWVVNVLGFARHLVFVISTQVCLIAGKQPRQHIIYTTSYTIFISFTF